MGQITRLGDLPHLVLGLGDIPLLVREILEFILFDTISKGVSGNMQELSGG